jgi:hypothetical protein
MAQQRANTYTPRGDDVISYVVITVVHIDSASNSNPADSVALAGPRLRCACAHSLHDTMDAFNDDDAERKARRRQSQAAELLRRRSSMHVAVKEVLHASIYRVFTRTTASHSLCVCVCVCVHA